MGNSFALSSGPAGYLQAFRPLPTAGLTSDSLAYKSTRRLHRFDANQSEFQSLGYGMDYARFRRIWRFYLLLLGTIFATCDGEYNGNGQYLLTHADASGLA
jgi:hypothetical protein